MEIPWKLVGTTAILDNKPLRLSVNVDEPTQGIHDIQIRDQSLSGFRILTVNLPGNGEPEPVADHYVRGNDLVATLLQLPGRTFRPQFYWRALTGDVPGVELVISVQTNLLASEPQISVGSTLSNCAVYCREGSSYQEVDASKNYDSSVVLFRPKDTDFSYVELIQPSDRDDLRIHIDGDAVSTRFDMFCHDLEKGVIRRGRLRSMFVPRENDEDIATELMADLERAPAPLTT